MFVRWCVNLAHNEDVMCDELIFDSSTLAILFIVPVDAGGKFRVVHPTWVWIVVIDGVGFAASNEMMPLLLLLLFLICYYYGQSVGQVS